MTSRTRSQTRSRVRSRSRSRSRSSPPPATSTTSRGSRRRRSSKGALRVTAATAGGETKKRSSSSRRRDRRSPSRSRSRSRSRSVSSRTRKKRIVLVEETAEFAPNPDPDTEADTADTESGRYRHHEETYGQSLWLGDVIRNTSTFPALQLYSASLGNRIQTWKLRSEQLKRWIEKVDKKQETKERPSSRRLKPPRDMVNIAKRLVRSMDRRVSIAEAVAAELGRTLDTLRNRMAEDDAKTAANEEGVAKLTEERKSVAEQMRLLQLRLDTIDNRIADSQAEIRESNLTRGIVVDDVVIVQDKIQDLHDLLGLDPLPLEAGFLTRAVLEQATRENESATGAGGLGEQRYMDAMARVMRYADSDIAVPLTATTTRSRPETWVRCGVTVAQLMTVIQKLLRQWMESAPRTMRKQSIGFQLRFPFWWPLWPSWDGAMWYWDPHKGKTVTPTAKFHTFLHAILRKREFGSVCRWIRRTWFPPDNPVYVTRFLGAGSFGVVFQGRTTKASVSEQLYAFKMSIVPSEQEPMEKQLVETRAEVLRQERYAAVGLAPRIQRTFDTIGTGAARANVFRSAMSPTETKEAETPLGAMIVGRPQTLEHTPFDLVVIQMDQIDTTLEQWLKIAPRPNMLLLQMASQLSNMIFQQWEELGAAHNDLWCPNVGIRHRNVFPSFSSASSFASSSSSSSSSSVAISSSSSSSSSSAVSASSTAKTNYRTETDAVWSDRALDTFLASRRLEYLDLDTFRTLRSDYLKPFPFVSTLELFFLDFGFTRIPSAPGDPALPQRNPPPIFDWLRLSNDAHHIEDAYGNGARLGAFLRFELHDFLDQTRAQYPMFVTMGWADYHMAIHELGGLDPGRSLSAAEVDKMAETAKQRMVSLYSEPDWAMSRARLERAQAQEAKTSTETKPATTVVPVTRTRSGTGGAPPTSPLYAAVSPVYAAVSPVYAAVSPVYAAVSPVYAGSPR